MERTTDQILNNDLIYINGEIINEKKAKVDGTNITRTHIFTNSVLILSNNVDMLDKGMYYVKWTENNSLERYHIFFVFKNVSTKSNYSVWLEPRSKMVVLHISQL